MTKIFDRRVYELDKAVFRAWKCTKDQISEAMNVEDGSLPTCQVLHDDKHLILRPKSANSHIMKTTLAVRDVLVVMMKEEGLTYEISISMPPHSDR